jgi:hypothetical protein
VVRSKKEVSSQDLQEAMKFLNLNQASSSMAKDVSFVLAIPILQPTKPQSFIRPSPVAGVLYVDSTASGFFLDDGKLEELLAMTRQFLASIVSLFERNRLRLQNVPLAGKGILVPEAKDLPNEVRKALEVVSGVHPPTTSGSFQFNIDHSDFVPDL